MHCTVLFANLRRLGLYVIRATIVFAVLEPLMWDRACNGGEPEAQRSVKSMINALASRNQAPKIMKGGEGEIAIFSADFDWQDQARVVRAISGPTSEREDDAWEALVDSCKDDRYCITTINPNEFPENWTVGDVCHRYALGRLLSVVDKHLDDIQLERQSQELRPVVIRGEFYELREWRNKHPKLKLYELQVLVCRSALEQVDAFEGVSAAAKAECKRAITAEIVNLAKTKRASFAEQHFPGDEFSLFNERLAKRDRLAADDN